MRNPAVKGAQVQASPTHRLIAWILALLTAAITAVVVAWFGRWFGPTAEVPKDDAFVRIQPSASDIAEFESKIKIAVESAGGSATPEQLRVARTVLLSGWSIQFMLRSGKPDRFYVVEPPSRYEFADSPHSLVLAISHPFSKDQHKQCVNLSHNIEVAHRTLHSTTSTYCLVNGSWERR